MSFNDVGVEYDGMTVYLTHIIGYPIIRSMLLGTQTYVHTPQLLAQAIDILMLHRRRSDRATTTFSSATIKR